MKNRFFSMKNSFYTTRNSISSMKNSFCTTRNAISSMKNSFYTTRNPVPSMKNSIPSSQSAFSSTKNPAAAVRARPPRRKTHDSGSTKSVAEKQRSKGAEKTRKAKCAERQDERRGAECAESNAGRRWATTPSLLTAIDYRAAFGATTFAGTKIIPTAWTQTARMPKFSSRFTQPSSRNECRQ